MSGSYVCEGLQALLGPAVKAFITSTVIEQVLVVTSSANSCGPTYNVVVRPSSRVTETLPLAPLPTAHVKCRRNAGIRPQRALESGTRCPTHPPELNSERKGAHEEERTMVVCSE